MDLKVFILRQTKLFVNFQSEYFFGPRYQQTERIKSSADEKSFPLFFDHNSQLNAKLG